MARGLSTQQLAQLANAKRIADAFGLDVADVVFPRREAA
jgi:hypothetical protein